MDYRIIICPLPVDLGDWRRILDLANSRRVQTLQKTERCTAACEKMKPCF
jgi:hypothetical protein